MGKVLGIISEYNPFHNGHLYHLIKSKKITNAEYTIAVIGGNFTQRGNASLIDKWSKTEMALLNGIDLVIELPLLYSISSAENFAEGAIKILDSLQIVDAISFGTETSDINTLNKFADILYNEPKEYKALLSHELSKGMSYPKARENALMLYLNDIRRFAPILSSPNNILGIEYLKAIKKYKSNIIPISIQRIKTGYNDINFSGNIASATAIRNLVLNHEYNDLNRILPISSYSILKENIQKGHIVRDISNFDKIVLYKLRNMSTEELLDLPDVSEGLEYSIKKAADSCNTIYELINIVNSKRYTKTRLQRILLYALLNITKKDIQISKRSMPYIRILGFNEKGKYIVSQLSQNKRLNLITSVKKFTDKNTNKNLQLMLQKDVNATNTYTLGFENDSWSNLDYTQKIITI